MSMAIRPRANIKPPKAFRLLGSIFLPPVLFPGFPGMVNSLGAGVLIIYCGGAGWDCGYIVGCLCITDCFSHAGTVKEVLEDVDTKLFSD